MSKLDKILIGVACLAILMACRFALFRQNNTPIPIELMQIHKGMTKAEVSAIAGRYLGPMSLQTSADTTEVWENNSWKVAVNYLNGKVISAYAQHCGRYNGGAKVITE